VSATQSPTRRDALLKEYGEGLNNFRLLTEIRFKLLALLPAATATAAIIRVAFTEDTSAATEIATLALSVFGLLVTLALAAYNQRNDQLYSALVDRAVQIERQLGLFDGYFATRPQDWARVSILGRPLTIGHRGAVGLIYAASASVWLFGAIVSVLQLTTRIIISGPPSARTTTALVAAALVAAGTLTVAGGFALLRAHKARMKRLEAAAHTAVALAVDNGIHRAFTLSEFRTACAELLDNTAPRDDERAPVMQRVRSRGQFHLDLPLESRDRYMPRSPQVLEAVYFVALITDLVPQWVHDRYTGRRT